MGACFSTQHGLCSEDTCTTHPRTKAARHRVPLTSTSTQDHGPGCPATALTSSPTSTLQVQQLPITGGTKTATAAVQATEPASAIAAAIKTPLALDPATAAAQTEEQQGNTPSATASAAQEAAAEGIAHWRTAPTVSVTLKTTTPKTKIPATLDLSKNSFIPLTLAWTAAERKCTILKDFCITLGQKLTREKTGRHAAVGALAASARLAADLACQLSTEQESHAAVREELRGKDEALAAALAEAARLHREVEEQRGGREEMERQLRASQAQLAQQEGQLSAAEAQLAEQDCWLGASHAQLAEQECQLSAAHAQLAEQEQQLRASHAQLAQQESQLSAAQAQVAQQEARLSLLPKTMARATELSRQLAAAESAAADAKAKLKAERIKGVRLAWLVRKTEHFAQTLEALHDDLPHLNEDDLTTIGVLGKGGFARVDHKTITHADGSTAEVAVKVVLPPEQAAAAASPAATEASPDADLASTSSASSDADSDATSAASSADDSAPAGAACSVAPAACDSDEAEEEDSGSNEEEDLNASSAGDSAPAAACSVAPATCDSGSDAEEEDSDSDEEKEDDSSSDDDMEDGSESDEEDSDSDEEEEGGVVGMDTSDEALQASIKSRALRLEGAVLNNLRGLPCILDARGWQGAGRTGLVLSLAKGGSLKELLRPVPEDGDIFVPQDREQVLRIAGGLCTALLAAHENGVAHLDIKPDNVLLDADLDVRLADWGTAAPLSFTAAQWRARGITGSAGLIYPGILYNPACGGVRADVYGAAALCYGMLTGRDYARECWEQYRALPKATQEAIEEEAAKRCDALGYSGGPTSSEFLMVAQFRDHVRVAQVARSLQLLGGASMPEPLAPLIYWAQQALQMKTWTAPSGGVTLLDMKSAIEKSWQRLHSDS